MIKKILPFLMVIFIDTLIAGIIIPILGPAIMMTDSTLLPTATTLSMRLYLYSAVLSAFFIFNFLASPIIGAIADQYGRKKTLITCSLGKSLGLFLTAVAFHNTNMTLLIASRVLVGAASATITIAQANIASLSTPEIKAKNLALGNMAAATGFLFGPILSGVLTNTNIYSGFTFSTPFFVSAILPFLTIVLILFLKDSTKKIDSHITLSDMVHKIVASVVDQKNRVLFIMLLLTAISWSYFFLSIVPFFTVTLGYDTIQNAKIILFGGGLFVFTNVVLVPQATKYFQPHNVIKVACFFMVIGASQLLFTDNEVILWLGVADTIIGCALCLPLVIAMISNRYPQKEQGKIMGINQSIQAMSTAVAAMTIGVLSAIHITAPYMIIIAFTCCIFASVLRSKV